MKDVVRKQKDAEESKLFAFEFEESKLLDAEDFAFEPEESSHNNKKSIIDN